MERVSFVMHIQPGSEAEYEKRHDEVWPDLAVLLSDAGIRNYSIFIHGLTLFAYLEIENAAALEALKEEELMWKWWRYMGPLMECNEDSSPKVEVIREVFHMD